MPNYTLTGCHKNLKNNYFLNKNLQVPNKILKIEIHSEISCKSFFARAGV